MTEFKIKLPYECPSCGFDEGLDLEIYHSSRWSSMCQAVTMETVDITISCPKCDYKYEDDDFNDDV